MFAVNALAIIFMVISLDPQIQVPSSQSIAKKRSEKIEARVGQEIITSTDLDLMIEAIKSDKVNDRLAMDPTALRKRALDTLIDQRLMSIYLNQLNMPVSDRDVDQRVNAIRAMNGIQTSDQFRKLLESQGMSFESFRAQVKRQMEQMQFVNLIRRQSTRTLEEKEIRTYYNDHQKEFAQSKEIELKECVLSAAKNPKLAEKLAGDYVAHPEKFNECVSSHSEGSTKEQGGLLGVFQKGMLRDDIEAQVFTLNLNEVAKIPGESGFQLLKVTKITDLPPQKFEDVKEKIKERLDNEMTQKELQKILGDLRASTFIKI